MPQPADSTRRTADKGKERVPGVIVLGKGMEIRTADGRYNTSEYENVWFYPSMSARDKQYDGLNWEGLDPHARYLAGRPRYYFVVGQRHTVVFADQVIAVLVLPADEEKPPVAE